MFHRAAVPITLPINLNCICRSNCFVETALFIWWSNLAHLFKVVPWWSCVISTLLLSPVIRYCLGLCVMTYTTLDVILWNKSTTTDLVRIPVKNKSKKVKHTLGSQMLLSLLFFSYAIFTQVINSSHRQRNRIKKQK